MKRILTTLFSVTLLLSAVASMSPVFAFGASTYDAGGGGGFESDNDVTATIPEQVSGAF